MCLPCWASFALWGAGVWEDSHLHLRARKPSPCAALTGRLISYFGLSTAQGGSFFLRRYLLRRASLAAESFFTYCLTHAPACGLGAGLPASACTPLGSCSRGRQAPGLASSVEGSLERGISFFFLVRSLARKNSPLTLHAMHAFVAGCARGLAATVLSVRGKEGMAHSKLSN